MSSDPNDRSAPKPKPKKPAKKPGAPKQRAPTQPARKKPEEPRVEVLGPETAAESPEETELSDEEVEQLGQEPEEEDAPEEAEKPASVPATRALAPVSRSLGPVDALQRYMRDVERHPLLSREEEHEIAVRFRETGDLDAAYRLVTANLRLVVKIAHEYHRNTFALLDLVQEGNVGLMHAVKKYDPYRGVKLSSYAAWWIRAYILRYIMENWRIVKLGTTQAQRKLFFNLRKEQEKLISMGFDPTPKLLAERLEVTEQDVTDMDQRLSQEEMSLDAPVSDENQGSRMDRLRAGAAPADERLAEHQVREILRKKLHEYGERLKDKERFIFENRLATEEPMTLQEIGDVYGITRERARQIEAKLVREFKDWIQQEVPDFKYLEIGPRDE